MTPQYITIDREGNKFFFKDKKMTKLHREDGLPAAEYKDGSKYWYKDGVSHREDGPAVEYPDGHTEWWINGNQHREDGPAVINRRGNEEYWLDDVWITKSEHSKRTAKVIELTLEDIAQLAGVDVEKIKIVKKKS
jgi:hypothetical protein